jgi:D-amino peptidase
MAADNYEGNPYRVFIAADMEGITGYVNWPDGPPEESWALEQVTREVNAAVDGAVAGGATGVIVSDMHWGKCNLLPVRLHRKASLVRGGRRPLLWMDYVDRCRLVLLIGFHAGSGGKGVLPHTVDPRITGLRVNGMMVNEALLSAFTAGYYGVPVGLLSGDGAVVEETKRFLPHLEAVVVKESVGHYAAVSLHPDVAGRMIRETARKVVQKGKLGEFRPYPPPNPVNAAIEFCCAGWAGALSLIPGVERTGGREVSYTGGWLDLMHILSLLVNWVREK